MPRAVWRNADPFRGPLLWASWVDDKHIWPLTILFYSTAGRGWVHCTCFPWSLRAGGRECPLLHFRLKSSLQRPPSLQNLPEPQGGSTESFYPSHKLLTLSPLYCSYSHVPYKSCLFKTSRVYWTLNFQGAGTSKKFIQFPSHLGLCTIHTC